jgi:drug/metabolite transporter (DMT)-like permease
MTPAAIAKRNATRILIAFAAVYVLWGSTYLFIRYAIDTIPPLTLGASRFVLSAVLLYAFARWRGAANPTRSDLKIGVISGVLMLGFGNGGVMWAEQTVASGVVALIVSSVPIWIVAIDWLRGRRPRNVMLVGLALGFAGIVILIGPKAIVGEGRIDSVGVGVLLVGSIAWSIGTLITRANKPSGSPLMLAAVQMAGAAAAFAIVSLATGDFRRVSLDAITPRSWIAVAYLVIAGSVIAYTAYVYLLGVVSAAKAATYAYVNPVIAVGLGWAFANEPLGARTILAAVVILAGVAIITTAQSTPSPATGEHPMPTPGPDVRKSAA